VTEAKARRKQNFEGKMAGEEYRRESGVLETMTTTSGIEEKSRPVIHVV
jgi:hypothetical protein